MTEEKKALIVNEMIITQVASLAIAGQSASAIGRQLGMSSRFVSKVLAHPDYKALMQRTADKELVPVIVRAKAELAKLVNKAIKVVEEQLDDGNLQAAAMVFKSIGLDETSDKAGDTSINVILPGAAPRETKDVDSLIVNIPEDV